jgi:hypothetical protein
MTNPSKPGESQVSEEGSRQVRCEATGAVGHFVVSDSVICVR